MMKLSNLKYVLILFILGSGFSNSLAVDLVGDTTDFYKSVIPGDVKFDLNRGDFIVEINETSRRSNSVRRIKKSTYEIKNISGKLPYEVLDVIIKTGHLDTVHRAFPDYRNSLKLDYTVKRVQITFGNGQTVVTCNADIILKSHFGKPLITRAVEKVKRSATNNEEQADMLYESVNESLTEFFQDNDVLDILKSNKPMDQPFFIDSEKTSAKSNHRSGGIQDWSSSVVTVMDTSGHGSGCIVGEDGYIVTNYHVVSQRSVMKVKLNDGRVFNGSVVGYDPSCDLALLKINANNLPTLEIDANPRVGQMVYVIGTPVDTLLNQSVSRGIISGQRNYNGTDYLQTDANINSGNSGGAMISENGKLLGVVNAKFFGYGIEGIGFAVPSKYIGEKLNVVQSKPIVTPSPVNSSAKKGKK